MPRHLTTNPDPADLAPSDIAERDGTTFLRSDGQWESIAVGTIEGLDTALKTTGQSITSATPANVTSLTLAVATGHAFHFRFVLLVQTLGVDIVADVTGPAATVFESATTITEVN